MDQSCRRRHGTMGTYHYYPLVFQNCRTCEATHQVSALLADTKMKRGRPDWSVALLDVLKSSISWLYAFHDVWSGRFRFALPYRKKKQITKCSKKQPAQEQADESKGKREARRGSSSATNCLGESCGWSRRR